MKFFVISVLVMAVWMGLGVSAQAMIMVDFGTNPNHAEPQVVQDGWENGFVTIDQHTDVGTGFGDVRHWVAPGPLGENYRWAERNRASLYADGRAFYEHPTLGEIGHVLQDAMKCDASTHPSFGDCYLDFNFTGVEAGDYELTTFHHSWFGQQFEDGNGSYNWAELDISVRISPDPIIPQNQDTGFVTVWENVSASHNGTNPLTDPAIYVTPFTSPGPGEFITVRIDPREGTGETIEAPINGFVLDRAAVVGLSTDFNDNGIWDLPDLNLVLFNWQLPEDSLPVEWVKQRPDTVGLDSLNLVLFNWQLPSTSIAAVPEPSTALCAIIGLLGVICLNRWRRG